VNAAIINPETRPNKEHKNGWYGCLSAITLFVNLIWNDPGYVKIAAR